MIPLWIVVVALTVAVAVGFFGGLSWQGRSHRSAHSFYDPAVSVSATIDRITAEDRDDNFVPEDDHDDPEIASHCDHGSFTSGPQESDGPIVRYYFSEWQAREESDVHRTTEIPRVRVPRSASAASRGGTRARPSQNIGQAFQHGTTRRAQTAEERD